METHPKVGGSDQKKEERQLNFVEMVRSGRSEGTTNSHQLAWEAMATLDSIAVWPHPTLVRAPNGGSTMPWWRRAERRKMGKPISSGMPSGGGDDRPKTRNHMRTIIGCFLFVGKKNYNFLDLP